MKGQLWKNYKRCLLAFQYLQECLYVLCEIVLRKQHNTVLEELPKFQGNCDSCTFDSLLPFHQYKKRPCPHKTKRKCYCTKRPNSRTLCPNDGFCSKLYDKIILLHRYRDPLWKNSDPRKWKESFWKVAVCYINTQGYHNKESAKVTDIRGLLAIIINNLEFENGPYRLPINGEDNLFKKAGEFNNDLHHSVSYVVDDDCARAGINLVRSILEIPQLQNETYVQDILKKFLNDHSLMDLGATGMCRISSSSGGAIETNIIYTHSTVGTNYDKKRNEGDVGKPLNDTEYARDCRHPELKTYEARLLSFKNWPRHSSEKPETLANAGLFYVGVEDCVRCFMCSGGLKNWDFGDDPWTEDCRWFPNCMFAREKKGDEFIALVQASAENNSEENGNAPSYSGDEELSAYTERVELRDPKLRAILDEKKTACIEMGYGLAEINEAVTKLRVMGTIEPTIEEIIMCMLEDTRWNKERHYDTKQNYGDLLEENRLLMNGQICRICCEKSVNVLFHPFTHHRLCMECSEQVNQCPVCNRETSKLTSALCVKEK